MQHLAAPDIKSLGPHLLMWKNEDDLRRNRGHEARRPGALRPPRGEPEK